MKCNKCGTENIEGARFCRKCGAHLEHRSDINAMDKFAGYRMQPTNLMTWKTPNTLKFLHWLLLSLIALILITLIVLFFSLFVYSCNISSSDYSEGDDVTYYCDVESFIPGLVSCSKSSYMSEYESINEAIEGYRENVLFSMLSGVGLCVYFVIFALLTRYNTPKYYTPKLCEVADYIEYYSLPIFYGKKRKIYKFFVKDGKMGLMDVAHYKVHLPAEYDRLIWRQRNKYITAEKSGRTYIIDINGVELK